jgi:membrane protease YdiL (CAAX protease family)
VEYATILALQLAVILMGFGGPAAAATLAGTSEIRSFSAVATFYTAYVFLMLLLILVCFMFLPIFQILEFRTHTEGVLVAICLSEILYQAENRAFRSRNFLSQMAPVHQIVRKHTRHKPQQTILVLTERTRHHFTFILLLCVAVCEELIYRLILWDILAVQWELKTLATLIIQAVLFGVAHLIFGPQIVALRIAMGVVYGGVIYCDYGVLSVIAAHLYFNLRVAIQIGR